MWGALAAAGMAAGLGLNYMGMRNATGAQKESNAIQQQELARRRAQMQSYMQNEMQRLEGDKGLQESALEQIMKLVGQQQQEIAPIRESFYKNTSPYFEENQLYLKDPVAWQKKQDELLHKSPYASQGHKGEGAAYMAAKANPHTPSRFFTKAAEQAWSDAIKGFSGDRTRRQHQALEAADIDYKNKVSDVGSKYSPKIDYIKDLMGISLGNSDKMGEVGARGLDLGMQHSRESADIGSNLALGKGEIAKHQNTFFKGMLNQFTPERSIDGYSNPEEYLMDQYLGNQAELNPDQMAMLKNLRKYKKNPKIIDFLQNQDLFEPRNV